MISKRYFVLSLLVLVALASAVSEWRLKGRSREREVTNFRRPPAVADAIR